MNKKFLVVLAVIVAASVMLFVGPTMSSANDGWGGGGSGTIPTPQRPQLPQGSDDAHAMRVLLSGVGPGPIMIWRLEGADWVSIPSFMGDGWDPSGWIKMTLPAGQYSFGQDCEVRGPATIVEDESREQEIWFSRLPLIDGLQPCSPPIDPPALPAPAPILIDTTGSKPVTVVFTITIEIQPYKP